MKSSLVISNFTTGYETDREPFLINNEAFPVLNNSYAWRGRVLRKRASSFLGRLQIDLETESLGNTDGSGNFSGNIFTILGIGADAPNASVVLGSIEITVGATTFAEPSPPDGTLVGTPSGSGTINYASGLLTLAGAPATTAVIITVSYYPALPVLGLRSFDTGITNQPRQVAFDNLYSYEISQPTNIYHDVNFYKITGTPFTWDGATSDQFWTVNYTGAMWTTNGNPGFHFQRIATIVVGNPTTITTSVAHGLVTGDVIFINEVTGTDAATLNLKAFTITFVSATSFTIPVNTTGLVINNSGIFQTLTSSGAATSFGDGIRWYDGDPTIDPTKGWVNFAPPLSNSSTPEYLVGAKMIVPFKNRLLFLGVYTSTSAGPVVFRSNRVQYSQDGTPFYNSLVPTNQIFNSQAWFVNVAARGGFIGAPITQNIVTVGENEDVLLVGFESRQLKLIFTGDDSFPFVFQTINSELGSQNTFSGVTLDTGQLTIGEYGVALTTQVSAQRIDLKIPDQVFDIKKAGVASNQVTAVRDYRNEFIYFTYIPTDSPALFPCKTLLYNYRDNTWATFDENYTSYGTFRKTTNITWAQLGSIYGTWAGWNDPWNFGSTVAEYPTICAGNQQGFVLLRDKGTDEGVSQYIEDIDFTIPTSPVITSPDHGLLNNDFIQISGCLGTTNINGIIFQIQVDTTDTFILILSPEQSITPPAGAYLGGGVYRRFSRPNIQTKQFPIFWEGGRQARIGTQRYMFQTTELGEVIANIFVSQNDTLPTNDPADAAYLPFSNIVLTRPETGNEFTLAQNQIWHRMSTSFNGDTVQIGISLSDNQMRDTNINSAEIILHAICFDLYPGPILA